VDSERQDNASLRSPLNKIILPIRIAKKVEWRGKLKRHTVLGSVFFFFNKRKKLIIDNNENCQCYKRFLVQINRVLFKFIKESYIQLKCISFHKNMKKHYYHQPIIIHFTSNRLY